MSKQDKWRECIFHVVVRLYRAHSQEVNGRFIVYFRENVVWDFEGRSGRIDTIK